MKRRSPSPATSIARSLRVSMVNRSRRGQTLILALAILFLLVILGSIFVTTLLRNLSRVTRQGKTDEALTLALAGLQYAANQFKNSTDGADWRPYPTESLWRTPSQGATPAEVATRLTRLRDPDFDWLSDNQGYQRPYVRFATGRGRFLLRVTFEPAWQPQSAASTGNDQFQQNSGMIHIESIGRPGEYDPNDPSFLADPTTSAADEDKNANGVLDAGEDTNNNGVLDRFHRKPGNFRKVEAYVPVGLLDQLLWVTNHTNEPGPAKLGLPMIRNAGYDPNYPVDPLYNQQLMEYPSVFDGTIRSNTDLEFYGRNVLRFYPARGEGLFVKGEIRLAPRGTVPNPASIQLQIDAMDDNGNNAAPTLVGTVPVVQPDTQDEDRSNDSRLGSLSEVESLNAAFSTFPLLNVGRVPLWGVQDEAHLRSDPTAAQGPAMSRSIRMISAPVLDQDDQTTGINRWRQLTRDSGGTISVGGRVVNTGMFQLTDRYDAVHSSDPASPVVTAVLPSLRARGLYFDNFDDIQFPKNRPRVKEEWLQSLPYPSPSWEGDVYTPVIYGTDHPNRPKSSEIMDLLLTQAPDSSGNIRPVIIATRFDPDVRQANEPQGASTSPRMFYNLVAGNLVPVGQSRIFDYPENGVVFAEGSLRVRGVSGVDGVSPQPLTIVSGGTIYIEGNVLQRRAGGGSYIGAASGWHVSLLAQDNVVLNPTAFTRVTRKNGAVSHSGADPDDPTADGNYHIQPGSDIDVSTTMATPADDLLLLLKHAGGLRTDPTAETRVTLNLPSLASPWPAGTDIYNWGGFPPPVTPPTYGPSPGTDYLFHEISPNATLGWGETSWRFPDRENKAFFLTAMAARLQAGLDNTFRFQNNVSVSANDQDYLLGKVAVVPLNGPLPIRIEATMYAYTGSWFVIPPPFFNDHIDAATKDGDPYDTRAYMSNVTNPANTAQVREDPLTYPINMDVYPFYREPLNIEIEVIGSITENMPAEPNERAAWTQHTWMQSGTYDPTAFPATAPPPFRPNIRYQYDGDLRRLVRVRDVRTGREVVAWAAPVSPRMPAGVVTVQAAIAQVLTSNSYAVTLPLAPRLPASEVFYEGNPL